VVIVLPLSLILTNALYGGGGAGGSGVNSYIDLENRPDDIIDTTVIPAGTGTSYRLFNVDNIKTLGAWAGIVGKPNQITNAEISGSNINDIRGLF
jgi:hypothetical protein